MSALFLACFVVGLVLAVYAMLHGVERRVPASPVAPHEATGAWDAAAAPSPLLNVQSIGAFVAGFGVAGYLLARFTELPPLAAVGLALLVGAAGVVLSATLIARWVIPGARSEAVDDRYLLQGHPASGTRPIERAAEGEIAYEADDRRYVVRARSWDDEPIAAGAEVVIERVEGGVAYVERWAQVEQRI
jgi:membrane protein implicated in regulation of membrane protease activity